MTQTPRKFCQKSCLCNLSGRIWRWKRAHSNRNRAKMGTAALVCFQEGGSACLKETRLFEIVFRHCVITHSLFSRVHLGTWLIPIRLHALATSTSSPDKAPDISIKNNVIWDRKNRGGIRTEGTVGYGDEFRLQPDLVFVFGRMTAAASHMQHR